MTHVSFFHTVEVLVVAALAILFFTGPWQTFCTDLARQRLFELRDRLFSLALEGRIEFDNPAYRATRDSLNHRIRYAERYVFGDMIAILIVHRGNVPVTRTLDDEFAQIDDLELRAELQKIHSRAVQVQLGHMVIRSPTLLVFTVLAPFVILLGAVSGGVIAFCRWLTSVADAVNYKDVSELATE